MSSESNQASQSLPQQATDTVASAATTLQTQGQQASEQASALLNRGISSVQQQTLGAQGTIQPSQGEQQDAQREEQAAESTRKVDGASAASVEDFIRDKYATATAKDFPSADKKKFASMEGGE